MSEKEIHTDKQNWYIPPLFQMLSEKRWDRKENSLEPGLLLM